MSPRSRARGPLLKYAEFLDAKPLYYDKIDLERMPRAWDRVKASVSLPKIIHLVGTNGKGTTGRFLASALLHAGYSIGHYTSPHILRFNERLWLNGSDATDAQLQHAFEKVMGWLDTATADALSYFEFTTLMAAALYEDCDYVVMEAGLGGEFDATAVFPKTLTLVTPIDLDHQAFLGDTVEAIAATKLRAMGPTVILGLQPHEVVYSVATEIAAERGATLLRCERLLDQDAIMALQQTAGCLELPEYLRDNLLLAAAALQVLGVPFDAQSFSAPLFGRLSRIAPNVWLDVGHNVLAARAIASTLGAQKVVLVYNSYGDKDYASILAALRGNIERVELIEVQSERAAARDALVGALEALQIPYGTFEGVQAQKMYLVFGSFSVAEAFIKMTGLK
ncbi:bifunctional folylpolyglutamate synthase/dihydrofolate synthase [Sulfurimonas sp. HSL-3221]|uniref:bifunctional folylpolyglutamate synthase/dihydrofolate synthase n=1 Tax=Thiomicrolovo sulfuroxydans TaxID=2894755 RepID=UPI001E288AF3|nr:bifunctional folylpolyglutamate synthase/dihydrofolate synthase [Sulfurimonas sp. HSL-3221]UFS63036.1 bifunctional folylpolyglutamate synthase/dihydrofolate synthase [Sulfurimonas sp. HSL-3221]